MMGMRMCLLSVVLAASFLGYISDVVSDSDVSNSFVMRPEMATLLGGGARAGFELAEACFVDDDGYIYLAGGTSSPDFPVTIGAFDTTHNKGLRSNLDGFVAKLSPDGSSLLWATYLGGSGAEYVMGVRADATGVYAVGQTGSPDFPTTSGAWDRTYDAATGTGRGEYGDMFVAKFSPDGANLLFSTYVGGSQNDHSRGNMAVDASGNVYVGGDTESSDFPVTSGAFDRSFNGDLDSVYFKLSADGSSLLNSTFLGGASVDSSFGLALHTDGTLYGAGWTTSTDLPTTTGALQTTYGGKTDGWGGDVYIVRFDGDLSALRFATYFGGPGTESSASNQALRVDSGGQPVLIGTAGSPLPASLTTPGAWRRTPTPGAADGFVIKLSADGSRLVAGTYAATGTDSFEISGIALDAAGYVYHAGRNFGPNYTRTANAWQPNFGGGPSDLVFTVFTPDLGMLVYSTFYGGSGAGQESTRCLWTTPAGRILMSGDTSSSDFPTTAGAAQERYRGGRRDAFGILWSRIGN